MTERKELLKKIEELEKKLGEKTGNREMDREERVSAAESSLEKEIRSVRELTDAQWDRELKDREKCTWNVVCAALNEECSREKVIDLLKNVIKEGVKEERLWEAEGWDKATKWFYRVERMETKSAILERAEEIRVRWKIKVSEDKTHRERKTRQILNKRAEVERARNETAKIKIEGRWICIEGEWQRWLEKEAKWITERDWEKRCREREKERLEAKLAAINEELGKAGAE